MSSARLFECEEVPIYQLIKERRVALGVLKNELNRWGSKATGADHR